MKPRKIDLVQGSERWLEYRKSHIGSSESSKILGRSKFGSALDVYNEKVNGKTTFVNSAMQRGKDLEGTARDLLSSLLGVELTPAVYESVEFPFMHTSLDAETPDGKKVYEIKVTSSAKVAEARSGKIEPDYLIQCNKHMIVKQLEFMWMFFYASDIDYCLVPMPYQADLGEEIIVSDRNFYEKHLLPQIPPDATFKDYETRDDDISNDLALEWLKFKEIEEDAKKSRLKCEEELKKLANGKPSYFRNAGVKLNVISRKGSIDYASVCTNWHIEKEELEKYRKENSTYVTIKPA